MVDTTITDLPDGVTLVGNEWLPLDQGATTIRAQSQSVARSPMVGVAITTGAAPVTGDPNVALYSITTGGTGGTEVIDIPNFPLDAAAVNAENTGRRIFLHLISQTNGGDIVAVTADGSAALSFTPPFMSMNNITTLQTTGATMDYEGACICLEWIEDSWAINLGLTNDEFNANIDASKTLDIGFGSVTSGAAGSIAIKSPASTGTGGGAGNGGDLSLIAGNSAEGAGGTTFLLAGAATSGTNDGGVIQINAGASAGGNGGSIGLTAGDGAVTGGSIVIEAGSGGTSGQIVMLNLPTVDPGIAGALWADPVTHILMVSP